MVTKVLEEYLKIMYVLEKQEGYIRVTDIAQKLQCSKAGVTKTLKKLKEENLIEYEVYGEIKLTKESEHIAQKTLEAYDIVNLFLTQVLNVDEKQAEKQAKDIKKVMSDETINQLAIYVHKVLGLNSLECGYDINKKRCRECLRRTETKTSK